MGWQEDLAGLMGEIAPTPPSVSPTMDWAGALSRLLSGNTTPPPPPYVTTMAAHGATHPMSIPSGFQHGALGTGAGMARAGGSGLVMLEPWD